MINEARGSHVSPGIYFKEIDKPYSNGNIGNATVLGMAGETLQGPAFQPVSINSWPEFVKYFGGTSSKKFTLSGGSMVPKYELPYIAKEYLKESDELLVTRILGLSGYDAGPAWGIAVDSKIVCIIRSKATINPINGGNICNPDAEGDKPSFKVEGLKYVALTGYSFSTDCSSGDLTGKTSNDNRRFILQTDSGKQYVVSLIPSDREYISSVLGFDPLKGSADIYIEELYENALDKLKAGSDATVSVVDLCVEKKYVRYDGWKKDKPEDSLTRNDVGKKYVDRDEVRVYTVIEEKVQVASKNKAKDDGAEAVTEEKIVYKFKAGDKLNEGAALKIDEISYFVSDGKIVEDFSGSFKDYKESYRSAVTPWFVSELRGEKDHFNVNKLFRFYTISDGDASNSQVKISIRNIRPDDGLFDVVVRSFYDSDRSETALETFGRCSMDPNSENYIGMKIGTVDGVYELKSEYVMVEISDSDEIYNSVPCGFLGYPTRTSPDNFTFIDIPLNTEYSNGTNDRKQYFGISELAGIDTDSLKYKGKDCYRNGKMIGTGFHLDERVNVSGSSVTVDGASGYNFKGVSSKNTSFTEKSAIIFTEEAMKGTLYEKKELRKFTACPYGGFDGWDIYRSHRTNGNDYRADQYKAKNFSGAGVDFPEGLILPERKNNSDYYAYLAGYNTFSNPEETNIDIFATPSIDWKENTLLVQDCIEMIEDVEYGRGGDVLYIVNTPEAISGELSYQNANALAKELARELHTTGIDSSYIATYWPWVKCYDGVDRTYINLPVTKDLVRNLAYIDIHKYPWFAPAGVTEKGFVNCVRAEHTTRCNEEDALYEGCINPVKTFARDGVKIWGNKTIYSKNSPLNRINVRRLMNRIKKLITASCRSLIFEPNDYSVKQEFLSLVTPILDNIRSNRGITDYKIEVDLSAEAMDEHVLPAKIWIKPTPTLEYIDLVFVITPQGGSFTE